ncbi:MAG: hypothetical protein A3A73_04765 [Omnitrophica bacterium RIFCSPLOWO2_01_FULL_50_24]|nr:MAG: hypothetical protein A3A73_04765 [Omnitrophica bacterium RIFCSPLOWO2_01_FULL_50_24]
MSKTLKFFAVLIAIGAASVLLTPVLGPFLPMFKFERIFNRLIMIFTVAAAVLFVRSRRWSLAECGFDFSCAWRRLLAFGFATGAVMVLAISVIEVIWGPRYIRHPMLVSDIVQRFLKGMISGTVVGIVEEFFFRGFIFVQLEKKMKTWIAVCAASIFYSLVHFLDNGQIFIPQTPGARDALRLLVGYVEPIFFQTAHILPEAVGLFLFGILLTVAFLKTRSLFLPIGIHAGTVFMIKWEASFVRKGYDVSVPWFGNAPHYDGSLEWALIILTSAFIYWIYRTKRQS